MSSRRKVNAFESRGLIPGRMEDTTENYGVTKWLKKKYSENGNLY